MRIIRKTPQNINDVDYRKHVLLLQFLAGVARVGFVASTFILLVSNFKLDTFSSSLITISLQGFTIFSSFISDRLFSKFTVRQIQYGGAFLGFACALSMAFTHNFYFFMTFVLIASIVKVAFETTLPAIGHKHIEHDKSFASKIVGFAQAGVLAISAIIACLMMMNLHFLPIYITSGIYLALSIAIYKGYIKYEDSQFHKPATNEFKKVKQKTSFNTRTLSHLDLSTQIAGGMSACLMPVVFKTISHVSQGTDSVLVFIVGMMAFVFGTKILPLINNKLNLSLKTQWYVLIFSIALTVLTSILFTTYFGMYAAFIGAALNGIGFSLAYAFLHSIAANEMDKHDYQLFNCGINQRAAMARIIAPISIGLISKFIDINSLMIVTFAIIFVVLSICILRVSIITRELNIETKPVEFIFKPSYRRTINFSANGIYATNERRRNTFEKNYRSSAPKPIRRYNGKKSKRPSSHRIRDYLFEIRRVLTFSQTYKQMVTTWRSHRFRRNAFNYSSA